MQEYQLGQIVYLQSNPEITGAIVDCFPGSPEDRYEVFIDGTRQTFYASQIALLEDTQKVKTIPIDEFHAYLTALQIQNPGSSTLYSLNAARIDFIPYQFRPVLKFIRADRPRMLIADSVGVGKTIEAGLILRELQARREINSILIICPRPLVTERKWEIEMKRFDERFSHLDGSNLKYCIDELDKEGTWPVDRQKVILPYSLFDESLLYGRENKRGRLSRKGLLDLDPPPRFDLVIVDEAHHIRNTDTFRHKGVRFFCDNAEAVIFLTATPIQLGDHDLFVLLNVLRPDLIIDQESFTHMSEPNPFINKAVDYIRAQHKDWIFQAKHSIEQAAMTPWGLNLIQRNPDYKTALKILSNETIEPESRIKLISSLESLHTFNSLISRTRRRDIGDFTVRKPETVHVNFTEQQRDLHDSILNIQAEIFSRLHGDINVKFMMTTIRRQAASCLFGLVPMLGEILSRHIDDLSWQETDVDAETPQNNSIRKIETEIQKILTMAGSLDSIDPKLEALKHILEDKQKMKNNKVMLFSSFRHTLKYIYEALIRCGFRVGLVHGGTPDEERVIARVRFSAPTNHPDTYDVLLFSEIGCEGLDYQFCDCIVNYDLPWNPMRIEQRIGRIDRMGQTSETVAIYNLITPGTVDADIYERCLLRIGVFENALGGSEEILGKITREIRNIADNFNLSDLERSEKLQQLADNEIRLIQEQEELESKQVELFGLQVSEDQWREEINQATSFWLSKDSLQNLVEQYLKTTCDKEGDFILGDKPVKTLRLSQDHRNSLLQDYKQLLQIRNPLNREWENWLKGDNPHLPITFDPKFASNDHSVSFIFPLHPLVKQASISSISSEVHISHLKLCDSSLPAGKYLFTIFQWKYHGFLEDTVLIPLSTSNEITDGFHYILENAVQGTETNNVAADLSQWDDIEHKHYETWYIARGKHRARIQEIAKYRKESLHKSHEARISLLNDQLGQTGDVKIQRMRLAQIRTAENDYNSKLEDIKTTIEKSDITFSSVAYGILEIIAE